MAITKRLKFQEIYEYNQMRRAFEPPKFTTHRLAVLCVKDNDLCLSSLAC